MLSPQINTSAQMLSKIPFNADTAEDELLNTVEDERLWQHRRGRRHHTMHMWQQMNYSAQMRRSCTMQMLPQLNDSMLPQMGLS